MDLILRQGGHARVPVANERDILVHLVRLDLVEDDAMDVLSTGDYLREGSLELRVVLTAFFGAVDELRQRAFLPLPFFLSELFCSFFIPSL